MLLCCCKIGYLVGGWYEPLLVRERTSIGSSRDQYRSVRGPIVVRSRTNIG